MAARPRTSRIRSPTWPTTVGDSPSDGSSMMIRSGLAISDRPIASICCSPPDSVPARWRERSRRRGNSSYTEPISHSPRPRCCRAIRRFSSTVSEAKTRRPWGTMLIPARATSWAASVRTSEPRKRIEPACRDRWPEPADRPQQGRLAHPVAPEQGEHLALADAQRDPVEHPRRGVARLEIDDLKHGPPPGRGRRPGRSRRAAPRPGSRTR